MRRIIVADEHSFKYLVEYMSTYEGVLMMKGQLTESIINECEECIAVQKGDWLPDFAYAAKKLSIMNTEQLCDPTVEARVLNELKAAEAKYGKPVTVYDYSEINCSILKPHGYNCIYIPYVTPVKEKEFLISCRTPPIYDVGFSGGLNDRRRALLESLIKSGLRVHYVPLFGDARDKELAKCRYILNIHWAEHFDIFESMRCNRWLDSGYHVISENSREAVDHPNLILTSYENMKSTILALCMGEKHINALTKYITNCLKPRGSSEYQVHEAFDEAEFLTMKQDGMLLVKKPVSKPGYDHVQIGGNTLFRRTHRPIEWLLDDGTLRFDSSNTPLYRRHVPPPIETLNAAHVISCILRATGSETKTYVEYGVRSGSSIETISNYVKVAYGVDTCDYTSRGANIKFYKMPTDTFSSSVLPTIQFDYAFIHAGRSSEQMLADFEYLYKALNRGGYIFLHYTYPCDETFLRPDYCNDCYKSPLLIKEKYPGIEMLTLPINPGITIVHKI